MFDIPILLIIFNRPDTTKLVFEKIREVKPKQLFIAADGPRKDKPFEKEICETTRTVVLESIDWDCEVKTLLRNKNLGCGVAVSSSISWFFENVESGIILEDDCIPIIDFFYYCRELLNIYKNNVNVFHISGSKLMEGKNKYSYNASKYPMVWGWATWRRAWSFYEYNLTDVDEYIQSKEFSKICSDVNEQWYWSKIFNSKFNTWDFQWMYAIWKNKGISISPSVNLVSNIGFNKSATHTKEKPQAYRSVTKKILPLKIPSHLKISYYADLKFFYTFCIKRSIRFILISNIKYKLSKLLK